MKTIFTLLLLTVSIFCSVSTAEKAEHQIERFSQTVSISEPTTIKIINHYGDIRIRKADDDQFIYHGVAQSQASQQVSLDFQQNKSQITAVVKYSSPDKTTDLDRFDLALIVPDLVTLDIEIEQGNLTTKGLASAIKVRTNDANIQIKTSKAVDLLSKHGDVELSIKATDAKTQSTIQTYEGAVTVLYYEAMPRFEVNTGKYITSNSVPLLNSGSIQGRTQLYGDSNNNYYIKIKTDTGQVSLIDLAQ